MFCPFLGYPGQDFDWADYLKQCGAEAAPQSCFPCVSIHIIMCSLNCIYFIYLFVRLISCLPRKHNFKTNVLSTSVIICVSQLNPDHGFKENMKLEAVNPEDPEEMCVATITKVKDSCLWLQLESKWTLKGRWLVFLKCHFSITA